MLYTVVPSPRPGGEVVLYYSPDEAQAAIMDGQQVLGVSVHYDALMSRLVPIGSLYRGVDRGWTTPAERHTQGHVIARGPIPEALCFTWPGAVR